MSRNADPGSTLNPNVRRQFDRLDKALNNQEFVNSAVSFANAVQDNRLNALEAQNVCFLNSFSHALTSGVTRFFNLDGGLPSYDPRATLSAQAGPPAWTRFTAPLNGIYTFHYRISFTGLTAGTTVPSLRVSVAGGAEEVQWDDLAPRATQIACGSFPQRLTAGQTVDVGVRASSAGVTMNAARLAIVLEGSF